MRTPIDPPALPPTPVSASLAIRRSMQSNRSTGTRPEVALRSALHRLGLRFRKNRRPASVPVAADVLFPSQRVAVFVDGCYWHGCPAHFRLPAANRDYWTAKVRRNVERDRRTDELLNAAGWTALRVWEHEPLPIAASRVAKAVTARR